MRQSGGELAILKGHMVTLNAWSVSSAVFSADGKRVLTAGETGRRMVWDVATGTLLTTFKGHRPAPVNSAVFSPDGKRVVTTCTASKDGTARMWDAAGRDEPIMQISNGHTVRSDFTAQAVFSPDGKRVLTSHSSDGTAQGVGHSACSRTRYPQGPPG